MASNKNPNRKQPSGKEAGTFHCLEDRRQRKKIILGSKATLAANGAVVRNKINALES